MITAGQSLPAEQEDSLKLIDQIQEQHPEWLVNPAKAPPEVAQCILNLKRYWATIQKKQADKEHEDHLAKAHTSSSTACIAVKAPGDAANAEVLADTNAAADDADADAEVKEPVFAALRDFNCCQSKSLSSRTVAKVRKRLSCGHAANGAAGHLHPAAPAAATDATATAVITLRNANHEDSHVAHAPCGRLVGGSSSAVQDGCESLNSHGAATAQAQLEQQVVQHQSHGEPPAFGTAAPPAESQLPNCAAGHAAHDDTSGMTNHPPTSCRCPQTAAHLSDVDAVVTVVKKPRRRSMAVTATAADGNTTAATVAAATTAGGCSGGTAACGTGAVQSRSASPVSTAKPKSSGLSGTSEANEGRGARCC